MSVYPRALARDIADASKRTRSRVSARTRPPRSSQKFARKNRSREPPLPHEHRLTLANVKWRPLLTSFSTLVRICPSSDSATMAVALDRRADWLSRSRDPAGRARLDIASRWGQERRGYVHAVCRPSLRQGPLVSVAPLCAIMAVYRPDPTRAASGERSHSSGAARTRTLLRFFYDQDAS